MKPDRISYDYTNTQGEILHRTIRYTREKKFAQRRPSFPGETIGEKKAHQEEDGTWWIKTLEGIETVIYHLPAIAQRPEETIVLVEGEKDAQNGFKRGLLTSTNPGGSKGWKDHHANFLTGRRVLIIPDNDEPGRDRIPRLVFSLQNVGCQVSVLDWGKIWPQCPDKGDLSDYLVAHPDIEGEDLLQRLEAASIRHLSMQEVQVVTEPLDRPVFSRPGKGCSCDSTARAIASDLAARGFYKWNDFLMRRNGMEFETFSTDQLIALLNALIKWVEIDKDHQEVESKGISRADALAIVWSPSLLDALPRITACAEVPIWVKRSNGKIELLQPGLDEETGIEVAGQFNYRQDLSLDEAIKVFEKVTMGLPMDYPEKRTRWILSSGVIAMFLASYLREFFRGEKRMMLALTANRPGCGKSETVKAAMMLTTNQAKKYAPDFRDDKATRRDLDTIMLSGHPCVVWDEPEGPMKSGPLQACLTENVYTATKLYEKKDQSVANETQFFLTHNNPIWSSPDLKRRTLIIPLRSAQGDLDQPAVDRAHVMDGDQLADMRSELLAACCSLVKNWINQGCPNGAFQKDSFETYTRTLGGICEAAGLFNPFQDPGIKNADLNKSDRNDLFDLLADSGEINGNLWTFEEIRSRAREEGLFDRILDATAPTDSKLARSEATSLTKALGFDWLGGDGLPLRFGGIEVTRIGRAPRSQDARRGTLYRIVRTNSNDATGL